LNSKPGFSPSDPISIPGTLARGTYIILTGTVDLSAGSHHFTVTHDDGAELKVGGTTIFSHPSPTVAITDGGFLTVAGGPVTFSLAYGEVNGLPAVLNFQIDGQTVVGTPVPEPATDAMALSAIPVGLFVAWRRRKRAAA
jgi:hypothetical protein